MSNSIIDQQQQTTDFVAVLQKIEERAAFEQSYGRSKDSAQVYALIEGLAQAVRNLYIQQQQGWAPVMEDKR